MSEKPPEKIYVIQETALQSILTDVGTFGSLIASFWVNYQFLGNGVILQIVLGICFFVAVGSKSMQKTKMTSEEARKHFTEGKP